MPDTQPAQAPTAAPVIQHIAPAPVASPVTPPVPVATTGSDPLPMDLESIEKLFRGEQIPVGASALRTPGTEDPTRTEEEIEHEERGTMPVAPPAPAPVQQVPPVTPPPAPPANDDVPEPGRILPGRIP